MSGTEYVVCDKCGTVEVRTDFAENEKWKCQTCGSEAAWLFAGRREAYEHASMIVAQS